jgi:DNA-binding transcriptional LysR family regulator
MHVTLSQLRAFERIVRLGSFHAAARELKLSQPSVSLRIRELEGVLQTPLFVRRGPRVTLTAEGHALVEYADRVLDATGEMIERFRTRDPLKGMLRLGMNETFALVCLPELLRRLEQTYPQIRTSVFVGDTGQASRKLDAQELDIAIVSEPSVAKHVKQEPLGKNEFGWFTSAVADLPRRVLSPSDLRSYHLIVPPPPARLHTTISQWFADAGTRPARVSMCNSISATIETVLHGTSIGILPVRVMQDHLDRKTVKRLRVLPKVPAHRVSICYQISEFGPALKLLVDLTRELTAQQKVFVA